MANQYPPWSEAELNRIRELSGNFSSVYIGEQIGRSADSIRNKIKKLGLPSFISAPPKPKMRPLVYGKPKDESVKVKTYVEPREGLRQPLEAKSRRQPVSYAPLEWCQNCHAPVSSWSEHVSRMSHMGCQRPAA